MRSSGVAFDNLRAEMSRRNLRIGDMAQRLGYNRDTLSRKLSKKSPLNLDEAFAIQKEFFPTLDIRYLFSEDLDSDKGA